MILEKAFSEGRTTLSEHESKELIKSYGIPVTREIEVRNLQELNEAVKTIRFPLVMKSSSSRISHKSERGLVKLDIRNQAEADSAFKEITSVIGEEDGAVLVQEMIRGGRELMAGLIRDPQFGPCVMFGLGGIFTEILKDVSFRVAPLERRDALEMTREIRAHKILEQVRGLPAADMDQLVNILITMGRIGLEHERIKEIDINPLILEGSRPVAVDALVVL
ncbi:MAG: carboxylate--amine ligase [Deltaproteobacteria bacterium HGW-Deltaproteobacteria-15]|nr:MAG: carboxylate--amine ligase [Deltaproteobacteria bacterium HGW-Deltaproteobacteria-15]